MGIVAAILLGGCTHPTGPRTVASRDLGIKIPAMKQAAEQGDLAAAAQLVDELESADPAVRFYAIQALQRLTGEDYGYGYYADREARRLAVNKWRQWLERQSSESNDSP